MYITPAKYPIKADLPEITHHEHLPPGAVELARIKDDVADDYEYLFIYNNGGLSIVKTKILYLKNGTEKYCCFQTDFPLEFLPWFYHALTDFQKPPISGGLHAGAMTTADQNVGGEMLCIQRTTDGYAVLNRSRCRRTLGQSLKDMGDFDAQQIVFNQDFLFEGGMLNLIQSLAEKFQVGQL